jgi:exosortase/archaeosortase family protein
MYLQRLSSSQAAFLVLYYDVIWWLVDDWEPNGDYSHGYMVVLLAVYFAWERRALVAATPAHPDPRAPCLNNRFDAHVARRLARRRDVRDACVARGNDRIGDLVSRWLESVEDSAVSDRVSAVDDSDSRHHLQSHRLSLQLIASNLGEVTLAAANVPVLREGNLIVLPNMTLEVAEACSGIRSLVALFTLAVVYGYMAERDWRVRAGVIVSTIPIAIAVNGLRVAATGLAANRYGAEVAEGFIHSTSGWAMFLVAGAAMVAGADGAPCVSFVVRRSVSTPLDQGTTA